jgi:hypothetical protein
MKPEDEYCAALATMILVTTVAIILIINFIFDVWN